MYPEIVRIVQAHSRPGDAIWAAPDSPEVYFLTGRRNPSRTVYDFFDRDFKDPEARRARILDLLQREKIKVVVINGNLTFSGPMEAGLRREIERLFPEAAVFFYFEVRWRP